MKEKKHIDELFKEQLQNYEAAPSPEVWAGIQSRLKKEKDDRKVIPLWWKLGGIAAVLALLLTTGNFIFQPFGTDSSTEIVNEDTTKTLDEKKEESSTEITENDTSDNVQSLDEASSNEVTELDNNTEVANEETSETIQENPQSNDSLLKPSETIKEKVINAPDRKLDAVAKEEKVTPESQNIDPLIKKDLDEKTVKEAVGIAKEEKVSPETQKIDPLIKKDLDEKTAKEAVAVSEEVNKATKTIGKVTTEKKANDTKKTTNDGLDPLIKKDISEKTLREVKEAVTSENVVKDTVEKEVSEEETTENKKSIFDAIKEDEEAAVAKLDTPKGNNWEVTPNFGPVFYNSLDGGSSIDPAFADNSQSGDVNFSYGVQVSYNINDKLSVRSGVNNVNLGYTTGGVELATGPVDIALKSVDFGGRNTVLSAFDKGTLSNLPPPTDGNPFSNLNPKSTSGNAELIQNLSYFEVPLELNYALLNNRFGINMIGGFSTLFLGNNEVSVRDGDFQQVLGEANNLNSLSFSTNIGLGFNYKISKRLKFNIEPMFKYQLNPYSDSSVDFRPYYLGVYSGLSFKF